MEEKTRAQQAYEKGAQVEQTYGGCGQCVLYALIESGLDISKDVFRAASGMAAGVGRQGETCGAVSGAVMALGLVCPYTDGTDTEAKARIARLAKQMTGDFTQKFGCIRCQDLKRNAVPCDELIAWAARKAEEIILSNK